MRPPHLVYQGRPTDQNSCYNMEKDISKSDKYCASIRIPSIKLQIEYSIEYREYGIER